MKVKKLSAEWSDIFERAIAFSVSDLHITVGQPLFWRMDGVLSVGVEKIGETDFQNLWDVLLPQEMREHIAREKEVDFSVNILARRFRVNAYLQSGWGALAMRLLPEKIPPLKELGMPKAIFSLLNKREGLLLVTGRTGMGKSTTLASFVQEMDQTQSMHILTLEDPIEYLYAPKNSFVSQRELGRDFMSFPKALKSALREMPDVLVVGEIRDRETMETVLQAVQTGIFVLGTLHTESAARTTERVEEFFPANARDGIRSIFAHCLVGIFSQQLLSAKAGGRIAATEVLLPTEAVKSLIRQGKYTQLESQMITGAQVGMQTMEKSMKQLLENKKITQETMAMWKERGI